MIQIYALQLIMFSLKLSVANILLLDLMVPANPRLQDALTFLIMTEGETCRWMDTNDDDLILGTLEENRHGVSES